MCSTGHSSRKLVALLHNAMMLSVELEGFLCRASLSLGFPPYCLFLLCPGIEWATPFIAACIFSNYTSVLSFSAGLRNGSSTFLSLALGQVPAPILRLGEKQ